ncbi:MAG TPA: NTP transferase domain-containing protein [Nitrososphaeraceae archaeon]
MMAAIMCGGKGSRIKNSIDMEKPLLMLKGKTMIELVLYALAESHEFDKIIGVTSSNTPKTQAFVNCYLTLLMTDLIKTEGRSYSKDLSEVLNNLKPATIFVVPADLPLLSPKVVQKVLSRYSAVSPCVSIVSDYKFVVNMGIKPSLVLNINSKEYCHTGISIIDSSKVKGFTTLKEYYLIMNEKEIAVNVNTKEELEIAERLLG